MLALFASLAVAAEPVGESIWGLQLDVIRMALHTRVSNYQSDFLLTTDVFRTCPGRNVPRLGGFDDRGVVASEVSSHVASEWNRRPATTQVFGSPGRKRMT